MRTISAELLATQKSNSRTPYVKLEFTSADGNTTVDYSTRRMGQEYHYEAYNEYATILLRNNDAGVADIKGYWIEPVLGFDATGEGGSATEGGTYPRMWVKNILDLSLPGTKMRVLELEGQWKQLKERHFFPASQGSGPGGGGPPLHDSWYAESLPIYGIMFAVLGEAEMTLAALESSEDDGYINAVTPFFKVNEQPYETYQQIIYRLIIRTKSYLRSEGGQSLPYFRVIYPQTTDSVDETYYSYQAHWFEEFAYKTQLVIPNHVHVYCDKDEDGNFNEPLMTGHALDQTEIDKYGFDVYRLEQAGDIHSQGYANFVAEAILDRAKLEAHGGRLVIPFDPRVELYDKVKVVDAR